MRLSDRIQLWIPIELSVTVQSLWERVTFDGQSHPEKHEILVYYHFLKLVRQLSTHDTKA